MNQSVNQTKEPIHAPLKARTTQEPMDKTQFLQNQPRFLEITPKCSIAVKAIVITSASETSQIKILVLFISLPHFCLNLICEVTSTNNQRKSC
jgi:hypothetical protein